MSGPVKVLYLIDSLGHGGAEHQLALTVAALDRERFQCYVCHLHPQSYVAGQIASQGVPIFNLGLPHGKRHWLKALRQVRSLIGSLKVHLVHTSLFESDIVGGVAGRLSGVPVVGTLCSIGGESDRLIDNPHLSPLKLAITTRVWGSIIRRYHRRTVAISQAVKDSAVKTYRVPEDRLTVIYRALPDDWFDGGLHDRGWALRKALGLDEASPVLLTVGRLVPQKGQRYLLEAMPSVLAQCPNARLLIVGTGELENTLKSLAVQLGIEGAVQFLGRREDVRELLALSDIFVFPSLFEGLGVSLLEACGMGVPCVASRVGPIPEVIEDGVTGLLVPPRQPQALAEAILCLASDRERARAMGQRARQVAQERFSVSRMVGALEGLYMEVLGQR